MSVKLSQFAVISDEKTLSSQKHSLFVLSDSQESAPIFNELLQNKLKRSGVDYQSLNKTPVTLDLPNGGLASFVILATKLSIFQKHTLLRKAVKPLLDENPEILAICIFGDDATREAHACAAYYVASVNAAQLPNHKGAKTKQDNKDKPLKEINIYGYQTEHDYGYVNARVAANTLSRSLTILPPNALTPTIYREKVKQLAAQFGWAWEEFDMPALQKMGAGAFYAVGQGSEPLDAAIVHLTYVPVVRQAHHERDNLEMVRPFDKLMAHHERETLNPVHPELVEGKPHPKHIALVGKGICFDTGGHNLKPAKYMQGMHEDMNGSAVALGILQAVTEMALDLKVDCWLAIAQNHIGPLAYKQNDVVTALNGMTIEIVHTDAEGRMVLADTLTLASRPDKNGNLPDVILDFATLTGSMHTALSDRMSGVIANRPELACKAVGAGAAAGERIVAFPYDDDFDSDLESDIADIKQCTLEGGADHIHAARFLGKFIENDVAWLHTDLSSYNRKGGLGAVATDTNGFGVGFGIELIKNLIA